MIVGRWSGKDLAGVAEWNHEECQDNQSPGLDPASFECKKRSVELLTSRSLKTLYSVHVLQALGCDGKVRLILVKAATFLASESLFVLEFVGLRWYVPTSQCSRIASTLLSPPLVSVFHVISQTARFSGGGRKLLNIKCVLWFSQQLLSEKFLIIRRTRARYDLKRTRVGYKVVATLL